MNPEFYTLAAFEYVADVQILKGRLEADGIPVFLRDENTLNSDPLISNAIGGVKLQVSTMKLGPMPWMTMVILGVVPTARQREWRFIITGKGFFINFFHFLKKESINV